MKHKHTTANESARQEIDRLVQRYPALSVCEENISAALELLITAYAADRALLIAGNGGSAADSGHIVGELMKGFQRERPLSEEVRRRIGKAGIPAEVGERLLRNLQMPLRAVNLSVEDSLSTAFANDVDPELVVSQKLLGTGHAGDVYLAISTSGNSRNILHAAGLAKALDISVVALTGRTGGALKQIADVTIAVPADTTADAQEYHLPVYHALCAACENHFFS